MTDLPSLEPNVLSRLQSLEREAILLADSNQFQESLVKLDQVLAICPRYASGLNNRAQVYRLNGQFALAMTDLDDALQYAPSQDILAKVLCI